MKLAARKPFAVHAHAHEQHPTLHSCVSIAALSHKGAGRLMVVLPAHKHPHLPSHGQDIGTMHLRFGLGLSWHLHDRHSACGCGVCPSQLPCEQEFLTVPWAARRALRAQSHSATISPCRSLGLSLRRSASNGAAKFCSTFRICGCDRCERLIETCSARCSAYLSFRRGPKGRVGVRVPPSIPAFLGHGADVAERVDVEHQDRPGKVNL